MPWGVCHFVLMLLGQILVIIAYPLTLCCGFGLCRRWLTGSTDLREQNLRAWQKEFNAELMPLGIYCKTRGHSEIESGQYGEFRATYNWVEFAFTPESVASLKRKPHLTGVVYPDGDHSCCHIDEDELCIFPKHDGFTFFLFSDWITRFVCGGYCCLRFDCRSTLRPEGTNLRPLPEAPR